MGAAACAEFGRALIEQNNCALRVSFISGPVSIGGEDGSSTTVSRLLGSVAAGGFCTHGGNRPRALLSRLAGFFHAQRDSEEPRAYGVSASSANASSLTPIGRESSGTRVSGRLAPYCSRLGNLGVCGSVAMSSPVIGPGVERGPFPAPSRSRPRHSNGAADPFPRLTRSTFDMFRVGMFPARPTFCVFAGRALLTWALADGDSPAIGNPCAMSRDCVASAYSRFDMGKWSSGRRMALSGETSCAASARLWRSGSSRLAFPRRSDIARFSSNSDGARARRIVLSLVRGANAPSINCEIGATPGAMFICSPRELAPIWGHTR